MKKWFQIKLQMNLEQILKEKKTNIKTKNFLDCLL